MEFARRAMGWVAAALALLATASCTVSTRLGMRVASAPVFLVLDGVLFTGEAKGFADRTALITAESVESAGTGGAAGAAGSAAAVPLQCAGDLRMASDITGSVDLRCNNGKDTRLSFKLLAPAQGFGYNLPERTSASITFGMVPERAVAYLLAPEGRRIVNGDEGLRLEKL